MICLTGPQIIFIFTGFLGFVMAVGNATKPLGILLGIALIGASILGYSGGV